MNAIQRFGPMKRGLLPANHKQTNPMTPNPQFGNKGCHGKGGNMLSPVDSLVQKCIANIETTGAINPQVISNSALGATLGGGHGRQCSAALPSPQANWGTFLALLPHSAALQGVDNEGMQHASNPTGFVSRIHRLDDDEPDEASGEAAGVAPHLETSAERRRRKLVWLCERHGREKIAGWGEVSEVYLRQIINQNPLPSKRKEGGKRIPQVGDDLARTLEDKVPGLCHAWFDNDLHGDVIDAAGRQLSAFMLPGSAPANGDRVKPGALPGVVTAEMVLEIVSRLASICDQAGAGKPDFAGFLVLVVEAVQYVEKKLSEGGTRSPEEIFDDLMTKMHTSSRVASGKN